MQGPSPIWHHFVLLVETPSMQANSTPGSRQGLLVLCTHVVQAHEKAAPVTSRAHVHHVHQEGRQAAVPYAQDGGNRGHVPRGSSAGRPRVSRQHHALYGHSYRLTARVYSSAAAAAALCQKKRSASSSSISSVELSPSHYGSAILRPLHAGVAGRRRASRAAGGRPRIQQQPGRWRCD